MDKRHIITLCAILFCGLLSLLAMASCTEEDLFNAGRTINLSASAEAPATRTAVSNLQDTNFETGKELNVHITFSDESPAESAVFTTSAPVNGLNPLTPAKPIYYPYGDTNVNIVAFYPGGTASGAIDYTSTAFSVQQRQTENSDYVSSDLMFASVRNHPSTDQTINLPFVHKMAKVVVNARGEEDVHIQKIILRNIYRSVTFTAGTAGAVTAGTEATDSIGGIVMYDQPTGEESVSSMALFPPQTIAGDFLEIYTDKGVAVFSIQSKQFESGQEYILDIVIGRQALGYTTTITNWNANNGALSVLVTTSSAGLQIADITENYTYDGTEKKPVPSVTFNGSSMDASLYDVQYIHNIEAGTAMLVVIFKSSIGYDNMVGIKSFVIGQAKGYLTYPSDTKNDETREVTAHGTKEEAYVLNAEVSHPLDRHGGDGTLTFTSSNDDVATVSPVGTVTIKGVGQAVITASMAGDRNYTAASTSYTLNVVKKEITDVTLEYMSHDYTGSPLTPTVMAVKSGDALLGSDNYTVSYSNNTNHGTATVTVTGTGSYSGTIQKEFTINQMKAVISDIDRTAVTISEGQSITRYGQTNFGTVTYKSSNDAVATVSSSGTVTGIAGGTATITASVAADGENGNWTAADDVTYSVTVVAMNTIFNYTGDIQTYTVPVTGTYRLEVYGAQGSGQRVWYQTTGGNGGYATGTISLTQGTTLYVVVGGEGGSSNRVAAGGTGGYNGGGNGGNGYNNRSYGAGGGGGATHIATATGLLSAVSQGNVLIVAGGGGGASNGVRGGAGGGTEAGRAIPVYGGQLTATGNHGQGLNGCNGSGNSWDNSYGSGGGGGGWVGGYAQPSGVYASGGGGTGYLGSGVSGSMSSGTRKGNGYARITYVP